MDNRKQKRQKKSKTESNNSNNCSNSTISKNNSIITTNSIDSSKPIQDVIMELQTVQASIIKNLFESIREILVDINIVFTPDSIHCTSIDGNKCACVHFKLNTTKFEKYTCLDNNLVVGINMFSLHKLIKPISNGDILIMKILRNERYKLYIIIQNVDKRTTTTSILKLLDIDENIITIPDIMFDNIVTIPCIDFQRHCKDMMNISDKVTITCMHSVFVMKCFGDFADHIIEIERMEPDTIDTECAEISGVFSLKYINLFIKSSMLCTNVEIYLKQNYPLILVYRIGSLGKIQFVLAPSNDEA